MAQYSQPVFGLVGYPFPSYLKATQALEVKHRLSPCEWKRGKLLFTVILLCGTAVEPLQAGEFAYGVGYMPEYSDNITRVSANEKNDLINTLFAGFSYQENTQDVVARVLTQATYNNYKNNTYDDETLFDLNSSAVWTISPQRFFWTLEDTFQQGLIDTTRPDTPTNVTDINILSTGPDVYFHLSPVQTLLLGARAEDLYTGEVDGGDNKRITGTASWAYQSTATTTLSLNYQIMDVMYDKPSNNIDYTRQEEFFRADFHLARSQYILDLGNRSIRFDQGTDLSGALKRFTWIRESTPQSRFGASYADEYSDSGTATLATSAAAPGSGLPSVSRTLVTGDVYHTVGGSVFYDHLGSRIGMHLLAGRHELDYATTPQDNRETDGFLQFDYFFTPVTVARIFTYYTKTEYLDFVREDRDLDSSIRLDHHFTRTVSLGLGARRIERHSSDPTQSYVDNRVLLTLLYSSGPLFTPLHMR
jgi:hypothetical protein